MVIEVPTVSVPMFPRHCQWEVIVASSSTVAELPSKSMTPKPFTHTISAVSEMDTDDGVPLLSSQ